MFCGIGGFARAIHALGGEVVIAADRDPFVASVHRARFGVPVLDDVAEISRSTIADGIDGVVGGFPCQPVSLAGKGLAQEDERWLWPEFLRIIRELEPRIVLIENVPGLRRRGMVEVLADLAAAGYDAEWDGLPAAAFGAPHLRDRLWITAYPAGTHPAPVADVLSMFPLPVGAAEVMRAGALRGGKVIECAARAPVSARRQDGWSYWAGKLLPTPTASDGTGGRVTHMVGGERPSGEKRGVTLGTAVAHDLVPTPLAAGRRKGARAMLASVDNGRRTGGGQSSPPSLEQHVELLDGVLPRELEGVDPADLPAALQAMLPTPTVADARGSRNATSSRQQGSAHKDGTTLSDRVYDGSIDERPMLPTPTTQDGANNGGPSQFERNSLPLNAAVMLPTPKAARYGSSQNGVNSDRPSAGTPSLDTMAQRSLWPTPCASTGDARSGGENATYARTPSQEAGTRGKYLQSEVCEVEDDEGRVRGALNPDWVDWLMAFPVGWTNPEIANEDLEPHDYAVEPGPRVAPKAANRNARLSALGNALVYYCAIEALTWALRPCVGCGELTLGYDGGDACDDCVMQSFADNG